MTPELAPPLETTTPLQLEDVSALDRFNVHRCPTRWVFIGTGLELVARQATNSLWNSSWILISTSSNFSGRCGSPVVKVSDHCRHVMSLIPVPLKTRRVGERCTLNL
ncbi:hypothetical protein TNCV_198341 [Trichonephila clavipes]|nr:hypothetical protein TNCV_198341 [Trichonephila clavipes]